MTYEAFLADDTHFGSVVHFDKPKRYYRNAFLLPSVGLNPSPLTASNGEGFKRKRYEKTQDAVIRNLEVVGEATKKLSATLRAKYPVFPGRAWPVFETD
ncbi:hypothetical protein [Meiothermus sp.]|uniref:HepT-like ribonuclease domain-containing protein n=1 Tax=Meiothermus sp. TaxID=1955249 RepID=UPI00307E7BB4